MLPDGSEGALLDYARKNRERLVLKPNRAYGGGVSLGASVEQSEWEKLLSRRRHDCRPRTILCPAGGGAPAGCYQFPVLSEKAAASIGEPFYAVMGFAPTENGLGILCRVSQKQVVNVAQHGGLAAVLVADQAAGSARTSQVRATAPAGLLRNPCARPQIAELRQLDNMIGLFGLGRRNHAAHSRRERERGRREHAILEALKHQEACFLRPSSAISSRSR